MKNGGTKTIMILNYRNIYYLSSGNHNFNTSRDGLFQSLSCCFGNLTFAVQKCALFRGKERTGEYRKEPRLKKQILKAN
jgi:hypothetical protein